MAAADDHPQPAQAPPPPARSHLNPKAAPRRRRTQPHRRLFDSTPGLSRLLAESPTGGPASRHVSSPSPPTQRDLCATPSAMSDRSSADVNQGAVGALQR